MDKFVDIINFEDIDIIKEYYYKIKNENSKEEFNINLQQLYWKKIIKRANIDLINWYYNEIKENEYFDIDNNFKKKINNLRNINSDQVCLFMYEKIIIQDEEYVYKIELNHFKRLLCRGFYLTAQYLLTTNFTNSELFDIDSICKSIVKYGNLDLVQYAIHSNFFDIRKVLIYNTNNIDIDSEDEITTNETLVYYLFEPNIKVYNNSNERYESIFFELITILDDNEYIQMANDLIKRLEFIISNNLRNILNFVIDQYNHIISPEIWLKNYIISILENNISSLDVIKPFVEHSHISNYTESLHNMHMEIYCYSLECMTVFYNEFNSYITSYHYFDIIVCDLPMFNPNNMSQNSKYLLQIYPDLYKDNLTIDNIIEYYTRYSDWDGNIIEEIIDVYPDFSIIDNNHSFFTAIREINMNRLNIEEPTEKQFRNNILDYLVNKYPQYYKSICVYQDIDSDDEEANEENLEGIYYLFNSEQPYQPINFDEALSIFFEKNSLDIKENNTLECLICRDIIDTNIQRIISCCRTDTFNSGHIYCENCLKLWLKQECRTCPSCRNKLF